VNTINFDSGFNKDCYVKINNNVAKFLKENDDFIIDKTIDSKLIITGSQDGYLKRVR